MNMDEEKDDLQKAWIRYMNSMNSEEADKLLDYFLSKFIHFMCNVAEENCKELGWGWKFASNVITHQLIAMMNQICDEIILTVPDDMHDSVVASAPLQKYLLEGKGWKLLWSLEMLGLKNIACSKDLSNSLIAHIPVVFLFSVQPTSVPECILKKLRNYSQDLNILNKVISNTCHVTEVKNKQSCLSSRRKLLGVTHRQMEIRHRVARERAKTVASDDSSSDNEVVTTNREIPHQLLSSIMDPSQSTHIPSNQKLSTQSLADDHMYSLEECSLSVVDYVNYVLHLLEMLMYSQRKQNMSANSSSFSIITFSLDSLKHIQDGHYRLEGWSENEVRNLKQGFVKLIYTTIVAMKYSRGFLSDVDMNEIVTVLLNNISILPVNGNFGSLDMNFAFNIIFTVLTLICNASQMSDMDVSKIISLIRTFLSCDGMIIVCSIISYFERNCEAENTVETLLSLIKTAIVLLKALRACHGSQIKQPYQSNPSDPYHHDDMLGSTHRHSITHIEPMCCVAVMCHLMLKSYNTLTQKSLVKTALKFLQESGICCCIEPSFIMDILFAHFNKHDLDHQQNTLSVIEKTIFPQLGFIELDFATSCVFCIEKQADIKNNFSGASISIDQSVWPFNNLLEYTFKSTSDYVKWQFLNMYSSLLNSNVMENIVLVTKHLNNLLSSATTCIKREVFFRLILPHLLKLVFELRNEQRLSETDRTSMNSFLAALPRLLMSDSIAPVFIQFGGIRVLCDIMTYPEYWTISLQSLKVLILMEIQSQSENSGMTMMYSPESAFNNLSMITFCDILHKYSQLFLTKISNAYHSEEIDNVSYNATKENVLSKCSEDADFKSNLAFLSDLWGVCRDIVSKVPLSAMFFNNNALTNSYNLVLLLLKNAKLFSSFGDAELYQDFLLLFKHLLMVILQYEVSASQSIQIFPKKEEFCETIREIFHQQKPQNAVDLQSLLDVFLECSVNSDVFENSSPKNSLSSMRVLNDGVSVVSSSDASDYDNETDKNYDGDTERSNGGVFACKNDLHFLKKFIKHEDIVKLVLNLICCFSKEINFQDWVKMATHVVQTIISFCYNSNSNKSVLYEQGICTDLLDGFSDILSVTISELKELQKSVLELFVILSQYSMNSDDLKKFITLCKTPSAPFDVLIDALNSIVDSTLPWPSHVLAFPCPQSRLKLRRHDDRIKYESFMRLYEIHRRNLNVQEPNPWNSSACILPLPPGDVGSVIGKEFSLIMWIMLDGSKKNASNVTNHVISFGSETTLYEIWTNSENGNMIFKVNAYEQELVVCCSTATLNSVLKPNMWHHVTVYFREIQEKKKVSVNIVVRIDGIKEESLVLSYDEMRKRSNARYFLHMGQSCSHSENNIKDNENSFYISTIMIFKGNAVSRDVSFYLYNLGSNVTSISKCVLGKRSMFFPRSIVSRILDQGFDMNLLSGLSVPSLESLQRSIILSYSAEKPNTCFLYHQPTRVIFPLLAPFSVAGNFSIISQNEWPSQQEPTLEKLLFVTVPRNMQRPDIYTAMHGAGGIPIFFFLFARVLENSDDEKVQASLLHLLLKSVMSNCECADYFLNISGDHVLQLLLASSKCILSLYMLKAFLDECLTAPILIFSIQNNEWIIDTKSDAVIFRPILWIVLMKSVFQPKKANEMMCIYFIRVTRILLRDDHPHFAFNLQQLKSVQMMENLQYILKDYYILSDGNLPLEVANAIPNIVLKLLSKPTDVKQLWLICNFLLLLHHTSNTYICHARTSFFFNFTNVANLRPSINNSTTSLGVSLEVTSSSEDSNSEILRSSVVTKGKRRQKHLRNVKSMTDLNVWDVKEPKLFKMRSYMGEMFNKNYKENESDSITSLQDSTLVCKMEESIDSGNSSTYQKSGMNPKLNYAPGENSRELTSSSKKVKSEISSTEKNIPDTKTDLDRNEIYLGLLNLIRDILAHSDEDSKLLMLDVLHPEVFIVLANNANAQIRHAVVQIIHSYLQAASEVKIADFLNIKGFHLLSNQLYQFPADPLIIGAFFKVMFFGTQAAEDFSRCNINKTIARNMLIMSWIPLLALLPNTSLDLAVCNSILSALTHLLAETHIAVSELSANGLCEALLHLILRVTHLNDKQNGYTESASPERDAVFASIYNILQIVTSCLFSSKDSSDFDAFCSMSHLFSYLEMQCHMQCGSSCTCVATWRDCQCIVFQAVLDFIEMYNYKQLRDDAKTTLGDSSLWEIMQNIPDNLNPYSSFILTIPPSKMTVATDQNIAGNSILESVHTLQNVERANKELPMTDAIHRFQYFVTMATDFIVYRDIHCCSTSRQKLFFKSLYRFIVRDLCGSMESGREGKRTRWTAVVLPAKESLRQQLGRLILATLALDNDLEQKFFILEVLTEQSKFPELLYSISYTSSQLESLPVFLYDLNQDEIQHTWQQRRIFQTVFSQLCEKLENLDKDKIFTSAYVNQFKKEWTLHWYERRRKWMTTQIYIDRKMRKKLDKLARQISEISMDVTKQVVDWQSIERKKFMEEVKSANSKEVFTRDIWLSLVKQFTHERAVWNIKEYYPFSWELDPTEGPGRIRTRLRRCHLKIDLRFLMPEFQHHSKLSQESEPFVHLIEHKMSNSLLMINKLHVNEKIEYSCECKVVMMFEEVNGEILIGDQFLHFIGEEMHIKDKVVSERWPFYSIKEILPRRFELKNNAFEIFMKNGLTFLVAFHTTKDLENVWKRLKDHNLPCISETDVIPLTQLWRDRSITNYEYLTQLNKLAGRSFNDLMQYPVFPFILADYNSSVIDLTDSSYFRNLSKPIAVQNKYREEYYINAYNALRDECMSGQSKEDDSQYSGPYHYGSHYSNSGTVLHFLVRLLPYTYNLIQYQDNNFDIPDRTFHSMNTSWLLVTKDSTSDVKELIPEFFFLPEFLRNSNGFNFGVRQTGTRVNDVHLPPWCFDDSRLFVLIHRQALEASYVTNNLNNWIDLVFGYKQTGIAAINALNVFPPATYFGMDISKLEDPITRQALQAMPKTVGQMPRQLFINPHPMVSLALTFSNQEDYKTPNLNVLDSVIGLQWGDYVGSPQFGKPNLIWRCKQPIIVGTLLSVFTNDVFGLQKNVCLLLSHSKEKSSNISAATYIRSAALISWGHNDGIVRIKFCHDHPPVPLISGNAVDPICLCASVPDCSELFIAHKSGSIVVYNCDVDSSKLIMTENRLPVQLCGHTDAVTAICISKAFSIVVTASEDKTCIIWDLNKLHYVRTLSGHKSSVNLVCVSETLGDIASVSHTDGGSCLIVHTINGELVGTVNMSDIITALCYSTAPEGISVNVIATGTTTGSISLWSSWDLKAVNEIKEEKYSRPIVCMTFSVDNQHLFASNVDGTVAIWEKPSKMLTNLPRFLLFT